jgi:hypothetical protein
MLLDLLIVVLLELGFIAIFRQFIKRDKNNIKKLILIRYLFKIITCLLLGIWIVISFIISPEDMMKYTMALLACGTFAFEPLTKLLRRAYSPIYTEAIIDKLENYGLYLRSFKDDATILSGFDEAEIIGTFNRIFPIYAVGQPIELISPAGAKRIYIEENNWREQIAILSQKAKFILLKISDTENFLWECKHCVENVGFDKLIFFWIDNKKSNVVFKKFVDFFKTQFTVEIPDYELSKHKNFFIYFKNNEPYRIDYVNKKKNVENVAICYLDTHPKLNEENEFYIKNENKSFKNIFFLKKNRNYPIFFPRWNWGAFMFSWIYGFFNRFSNFSCLKTFFIDAILLLMLVGALAEKQIEYFVISLLTFVLFRLFYGINGSYVSWISKRWAGKEIFTNIQKKWNLAGVIAISIVIILIIFLLIK